jgi:hypothetical protein
MCLDHKIQDIQNELQELDELIDLNPNESSLVEKRDLLFEKLGVLLEHKTVNELFNFYD